MCWPTIVFSTSLPSYLESVPIGVINYMIALILGCNFPLLSPRASSVSWGTDPSVGRMDAKVNKGCTVPAQPWYRVEASHKLPAGVQSRLMGSKKALRKRRNCSNSKPSASGRNEEACLC